MVFGFIDVKYTTIQKSYLKCLECQRFCLTSHTQWLNWVQKLRGKAVSTQETVQKWEAIRPALLILC